MDAVKFLEERGRMCKSIRAISDRCKSCPMHPNDEDFYCGHFLSSKCKEAVAIVEKWSAEHPAKSYLDVYKEAMKEKFGSEIKNDGSIIRNICRDRAIYGCFCRHEQPVSQVECVACWLSECKLPRKGE